MTQRIRALSSALGPDTRAAWAPFAAQSVIPLTLMTDSLNYPLYVAPNVSSNSTQSAAPIDFLSSSNYIATLSQIIIVSDTTIAANITSDIYFSVFRAGSQVGSARIAGWASGATAALTAFVPLAVPFYVTNTTALSPPPGATLSTTNALCKLKSLDVVTVEYSDVDTTGLSGVNLKVYLDIQ